MLPPDDAHDDRAGDRAEDSHEDDRYDDDLDDDEDLYDDDVGLGGAPAGRTHAGQPIRDFNAGEPIPDLSRIPQAQWRAALAPVSRKTRLLAAAAAPTLEGARVASIIVGDLMLGDAESRARNAPPPSAPPGATVTPGADRQVGFRLKPDDYERLGRVARLYGVRPSALARLLTVRGVNLALHDERRGR
jgi:hypothetical protein